MSSAAKRTLACDGGYVNRDYRVLTDGRSWLVTDYNRDLTALAAALAGKSEVRIDKYCP